MSDSGLVGIIWESRKALKLLNRSACSVSALVVQMQGRTFEDEL